jgi:hypothetical protein
MSYFFFLIIRGIESISITCDTWVTLDGNLSWLKYVVTETCVTILRGSCGWPLKKLMKT